MEENEKEITKNNMGYKITLTEKQLDVFKNALEFYSRFMSGQVNSFPPEFEKYMRSIGLNKFDDSVRLIMGNLHSLLFPELTGGLGHAYGIGNGKIPESDIAYEMYREVYVLNEKETPSNKYNVYKRPTSKISSEPMIEIKKINMVRERNLNLILKKDEKKK